MSKKRLILFAHYDPNDHISQHVLHYLAALKPLAEKLIVISTAPLTEKVNADLSSHCDDLIVRENEGYDFYSWKVGFEKAGNLDTYDEVVICNDSVYGPFFSLENIFAEMEQTSCDFWGMTDNHNIAYHIQSYFVVFRKTALQSDVFQKFWKNLKKQHVKFDIVKDYEVGLTQMLLHAGLEAAVYIQPQHNRSLIHQMKRLVAMGPVGIVKGIYKKGFLASLRFFKPNTVDPTLAAWQELIKQGMPFLKVRLLKDNPYQTDIENVKAFIAEHTDYDSHLIETGS